jgi:hypothetical protein
MGVFLVLLWGFLAYRMTPTTLMFDGILFGVGVLATAFLFFWLRHISSFADRHPELALMDGAEVLEWKKFEASAKGLTSGDASLRVAGPTMPILDVPRPEGQQP